MKKTIISVWFQIGVNVIGLPDFHRIDIFRTKPTSYAKSKYHR